MVGFCALRMLLSCCFRSGQPNPGRGNNNNYDIELCYKLQAFDSSPGFWERLINFLRVHSATELKLFSLQGGLLGLMKLSKKPMSFGPGFTRL